MTNVLDNVRFTSSQTTESNEDEFQTPIDISDILSVCKEYSRLGWQIQNQVEYIAENGVDDALKTGTVKVNSLPLVKNFLKVVRDNPLFGDAADQADECVALIEIYEMNHPELYRVKSN